MIFYLYMSFCSKKFLEITILLFWVLNASTRKRCFIESSKLFLILQFLENRPKKGIFVDTDKFQSSFQLSHSLVVLKFSSWSKTFHELKETEPKNLKIQLYAQFVKFLYINGSSKFFLTFVRGQKMTCWYDMAAMGRGQKFTLTITAD